MKKIQLRNAKLIEDKKQGPLIVDGEVYEVSIKNIISSMDEGRKPFKDRQNGKNKHWVLLLGEVNVGRDFGVSASYSFNFFEDYEDLTDIEKKSYDEGLKPFTVLFERIIGEPAPDELDLDEMFLKLDNKTFRTKVFTEKLYEVSYNDNVIATQLKYTDALKLTEKYDGAKMYKVDKLVPSKDDPTKTFLSYTFSPWVEKEESKSTESTESDDEEIPWEIDL